MACFSGKAMYSHFPKKFVVGDVHSNVEHKLHIMVMMMMIAAKDSVEEGRYCYSKNLPCSVGLSACSNTICLCRLWGEWVSFMATSYIGFCRDVQNLPFRSAVIFLVGLHVLALYLNIWRWCSCLCTSTLKKSDLCFCQLIYDSTQLYSLPIC